MENGCPSKANLDVTAKSAEQGSLANGRAACHETMEAQVTRAALVDIESSPDNP
jgi:hypothetical protein